MNNTVNTSEALSTSVTDVLTNGLQIQESIIKVMGVGGGGCNGRTDEDGHHQAPQAHKDSDKDVD